MTPAGAALQSPAPMADLALRCQALCKRYPPDVLAVDGLDLEVARGECFGLLGPNGAGKTTTVEILEGLLAPTAGLVEVLGRRWAADAHALRQRIGITLQQTQLPDRLSVEEVLALFRCFYASGPTVDEVLGLVSLEEKRGTWTSRLSGGQRQRLAVACALVGDPELLFLDEPTTGLDPQSRRQLWDVVQSFGRRGLTVLLTTHAMDEAERLCDRVAVLDHGKVIALGSPRELIRRHAGDEIVELAADRELDEAPLRALPGVQAVRRDGDGYLLTVARAHVTLAALVPHLGAVGATLTRVATRSATLEDVFVTLTGRHLRD